MARRANSLVATSGLGVVGFNLPPLLIMSLAILGLVTMRRGGKEGLFILLGSMVLLGSVALLLAQTIGADLILLTILWFMVWGLAMVYRQMMTPAWMINAAGLMGVICVAGFYLQVEDPAAFWLVILEQHLKPLFVEQRLLQSDVELDTMMGTLASVLTGGLAALLSIVLIVSMLLARWWQAMLYNPGGFRQEFYALRLGYSTAIVLVVLLALSLLGQFAISTDMATVVWLLFFFQGMAVLHSLITLGGLGNGWLVGLYMLLIAVPNFTSPVISGVGLIDTWFDFRRRASRKDKPENTE